MITLDEHNYPLIGETLYQSTLPSGFKVFLLPKKGVRELSAVLNIKFGAIDTNICKDDVKTIYPAGIAHFLEHKVFEMDDGGDAALHFSRLGADCNAYTSFDKTAYTFTTTAYLKEALEHLLTFTATIHLTEESVEREKAIIEQEISMYQDDADAKLYQTVLANLFPKTALATDIAGDKDSIWKITKEDLEENHRLFYRTDKQTLTVIGDFDPRDIFECIKTQVEKLTAMSTSSVKIEAPIYYPVKAIETVYQDIISPKVALAFRGPLLAEKTSTVKQKILLKLYLAMILGWTSKNYQTWYDEGLIDDSFDIEVDSYRQVQFIMISTDTKEPISLSTKLKQSIKQAQQSSDLNESHFKQLVYELYGDFMRSLDSVDTLVNQLSYYSDDENGYLGTAAILRELTFTEVLDCGAAFFKDAQMTEVIMLPK